MTYHRERASFGFTLLEMLIAVAVVAVVAALAIPSFNDLRDKNRVKNAAEAIHGLILQAKSELPIRADAGAVNGVSVSIDGDASPWCLGFATTPNCACSGTITCTVDVAGTDVTQVISGDDYPGVSIEHTFPASGTTFSWPRASANAGTVAVVAGDWRLNLVVSQPGRIRLCNPNDNIITGYPSCQ